MTAVSEVKTESVAEPLGSQETQPQVSIVVIARNEERTIGKCIDSLTRQDYPHLEIVFVDSSSTDRTVSIVERYVNGPRQIVFAKSGGNAAAARNAGLLFAHAPIVAFVDGDSFLDDKWLQRAVRYLGSGRTANVAGVGGPFIQVPIKETVTAQTISDVESTMLAGGGSIRSHKPGSFRRVKSLSLSGAVFWSDAVDQAGRFDESLEYCEDSDFCRRIRLDGYTLRSFNDLGAFHTPKYATLSSFIVKMWSYGLGRGRAVRRNWRLMTAVGAGSIAYLTLFCLLLAFGFILADYGARLLAVLTGGLYIGAITASSLAIAVRRGSVRTFFLSVAAYLALHIPYTTGLLLGIIAPGG